MWNPKRHEHLQPSAYVRRSSTYIDRQFQLKYSSRSFWLCIMSGIFMAAPLFYLLNQNYSMLRDLMFGVEPELLRHIDREQVFLNIFLLAVFVGHLIFIKVFAKSMTAKIVGPLKKLRNRFRLLSRGEYAEPNLRVREDDEFHDLIASFNYFYAGLQDQTHRDLLRLKEARKLSNHPILKSNLDDMIKEKSMQLNVTSLPFEEYATTADSRPAS